MKALRKTNRKIYIIFTLLLVVAFFLTNYTMSIYIQYRKVFSEFLGRANSISYRLDINDSAYDGLFSGEIGLDVLKDVYDEVESSEDFRIYEIGSQYLNVVDYQGPKNLDVGYEYRQNTTQVIDYDIGEMKVTAINCVQLGRNTMELFNIQVSDGELFAEQDYVYRRNEVIPVLLGDQFAGVYEIGDIFQADYQGELYKFSPIGFIAQSSYITAGSGSLLFLDNCIIMPMFSFGYEPKDQSEELIHVCHYANKISAYIHVDDLEKADQLDGYILSVCKKVGADILDVNPVDVKASIGGLEITDSYLAEFIARIGYIILVSVLLIALILYIRLLSLNSKAYAACIVCGADRKTIHKAVIIDTVALILLATVLSTILTRILIDQWFIHTSVYISAALLAVILCAVCMAVLSNDRLSKLTSQEEKDANKA